MNQGAIIADRYVIESRLDCGIPLVESWQAFDRRLGESVLVLLVEEGGRKGLRAVAERAHTARHPRLARIIEIGLVESSEFEEAGRPFIVLAEPQGTRVSDLLSRYRLPTSVARALVIEATKSLLAAGSLGMRHGAISPKTLTVTDRGRVILAGAGIAAGLAGLDPACGPVTEHDDATALVRFFVEAVTGLDPDEVLAEHLPRDLTPPERNLVSLALDPTEHVSQADLARAFPPRDTSALRDLATHRSSFPRLVPAALPSAEPDIASDEGLLEAGPAMGLASGGVTPVSTVEGAPATRLGYEPGEDLDQGLIEEGWGFSDFEEVTTLDETPTIMEAVFGFLHRRFPSWSLARNLYERAKSHTLTGPRFDATPWFLLLGFVVVVVVLFLSINWATGPFTPTVDLNNLPSHEYPPYTYGPTSSPSPGI